MRNITTCHGKSAPPLGSLVRSWFDEGLLEGKAEEKHQIAKKLLLKNVSVEEIAEITGLSVDHVLVLSKRIEQEVV